MIATILLGALIFFGACWVVIALCAISDKVRGR